MSRHDPHDDLRRLLHDTVDELEPGNGLDAIRARTKETTMATRPWIWGVGGAVVATAATITAVALAGNLGNPAADDPGPATSPTGQVSESPEPTDSAPPEGPMTAAGIYFLGDTPQGVRLYREFHRVPESQQLEAALELALGAAQNAPADPDYRSVWPEGTTVTAEVEDGGDGMVTIDLGGDLGSRPGGMSEAEAQMALEQLIFTAQAAVQGRVPVQFLLNGGRTNEVLGQPTSEPLANGEPNSVLALVSITSPEEGATVSGSFEASGVANSFEATVPWEIRQGDEVVATGFSTAEGSMDRLYPWSTSVDVSDLDPGEYTFVAMTSDPSGGAEGAGPHVDTRTITVE